MLVIIEKLLGAADVAELCQRLGEGAWQDVPGE